MKKLRILFSVFLLSVVTTASAQHVHGNDYLGIWTWISVDLQCDPVDFDGDLVYPISNPPEGIGSATVDAYGTIHPTGNMTIIGVGMPRLIDYNGTGEIMLHLNKEALQLATRHDTEITTYDLEMPVLKAIYAVNSHSYVQCYYVVRLVIKP